MGALVDLRAFTYQLTPIHKMAQWKLDVLRQELASAQGEVTSCLARITDLKSRYSIEAATVKLAWLEQLNVTNHSYALNYLMSLKGALEREYKNLSLVQSVLCAARLACIEQQRKLELIESHRESEISDFKLTQLNRMLSEADRDWAARSIWKKKSEGLS